MANIIRIAALPVVRGIPMPIAGSLPRGLKVFIKRDGTNDFIIEIISTSVLRARSRAVTDFACFHSSVQPLSLRTQRVTTRVARSFTRAHEHARTPRHREKLDKGRFIGELVPYTQSRTHTF